MPITDSQTTRAYTDFGALTEMKGRARSGDGKITEEVAQQFEAIFMQMMLSSMRKTIQVNEEFSNEKSTYYDLFDKQVAMEMAASGGIGLTDMLMTQLGGQPSTTDKQNSALNLPVRGAYKSVSMQDSVKAENVIPFMAQAVSVNKVAKPEVAGEPIVAKIENKKIENRAEALKFDNPMQFLRKLWNDASGVIAESGLDPRAIIAQAALETGWGKYIIKKPDGQSSHNLFGIKSGNDWSGDKVLANTLEFKNGVMDKSKESFRSYDSIMESVRDYVGFITGNDRYKSAVNNQNNPDMYVTELQRAGYATDPEYANKIINIMSGKEFKQFFGANSAMNGS